MIHEIKIPPAGESIASAAIARWYKKTGEWVTEGDLLVSLETDKVSNDLLAVNSGALTILVPEGEEVSIGSVIGTLNEDAPLVSSSQPDVVSARASDVPSTKESEVSLPNAPSSAGSVSTSAPVKPFSSFAKPLSVPPPNAISALAEAARMMEAPVDAVMPSAPAKVVVEESVQVEPARESEVAVSVEEDSPVSDVAPVLVSVPDPLPVPGSSPAPVEQIAAILENKNRDYGLSADGRTERIRMSPLRRKVSAQLVNVQNEAAILTTFNECDMSAVMELRKTLQKDFTDRHGIKLGFMSFFVKAVVNALKAVPEINAQIEGNDIVVKHFYDVSVAVGTDRGLVVPVIRDCDKKSFADIERDLAALADKARKGQISLEDLQGGVFTISNGGVYGSLLSTPIINPPQSGILGLHSIKERPIAENGQVVIRPMMYLALSYDHRLVDGKQAVTFLLRIKDCIENPTRLLLEA